MKVRKDSSWDSKGLPKVIKQAEGGSMASVSIRYAGGSNEVLIITYIK